MNDSLKLFLLTICILNYKFTKIFWIINELINQDLNGQFPLIKYYILIFLLPQ